MKNLSEMITKAKEDIIFEGICCNSFGRVEQFLEERIRLIVTEILKELNQGNKEILQ